MRAGWMAVVACGLMVSGAVAADKPAKEIVSLKDGKGQDVGKATFEQTKKGVKVKVELKNIAIGMHGVHIHQNAMCEGPDFKTAGPHFNPTAKQHGFENPMGHHAGDTPINIAVGENHAGEASFTLTDVTMLPGMPNSLSSNGGTSIVIHEHADDMKTDPSGASGNRVACGVVP